MNKFPEGSNAEEVKVINLIQQALIYYNTDRADLARPIFSKAISLSNEIGYELGSQTALDYIKQFYKIRTYVF
jgi:hypothetical protein